MTFLEQVGGWQVELENMPGFEMAMQRIYAWFEGAVIDRPPIRFQAHNAFIEQANVAYPSNNLRDRWFGANFQIESLLKSIEGQVFAGEEVQSRDDDQTTFTGSPGSSQDHLRARRGDPAARPRIRRLTSRR